MNSTAGFMTKFGHFTLSSCIIRHTWFMQSWLTATIFIKIICPSNSLESLKHIFLFHEHFHGLTNTVALWNVLLLSSDCSPHSSFLVTKFTRDQASFCWWFQLHCFDRFVKNKEWWTWLFLNFEQNFWKSIWSGQQVFPCVVGGDSKCVIYYFRQPHCLCHC